MECLFILTLDIPLDYNAAENSRKHTYYACEKLEICRFTTFQGVLSLMFISMKFIFRGLSWIQIHYSTGQSDMEEA
jgi:hypothetical protein